MTQLRSSEICGIIKEKIARFAIQPELRNEGRVLTVGDGIIRLMGLNAAKQGELIRVEDGTLAMVMNLERDSVGAIVLGPSQHLQEGMRVMCTDRVVEVPVGKALLGRVVNALGEPIDEKGPLPASMQRLPIERPAPGVLSRHPVDQPLQTGYKAIDAMVPIGYGQRELIIGDRQTGKTALAVDAILNQKESGVKCVYVAIGQKSSSVASVVKYLEQYGALNYTIVVAASASESAALQYIAPYSACAMGEFFRDRGEHALIVYDDLSKHAVAYRQISLLLRRPPGREAYPGDVFYLHSRLLERAACVNRTYLDHQAHPEGPVPAERTCGSLTALPIVETQAGDISAFVPTNVISITDGQLFLDTDLFNAGIRPAINPGISVSRVGGAAQHPLIRKVSGTLRTALAQFRELQAFSQFSSELDRAAQQSLEEGKKVMALLKQPQYAPLSAAEQVLLFTALKKGYFSDIPESRIKDFERALKVYAKHHHADLMQQVEQSPKADRTLMKEIEALLSRFKETQIF